MTHCKYVVSVDDASLGMPEVTLPVVPGMEGCHWPLRKLKPGQMPKMLHLLLEGTFIKAKDAAGWLVDYAGPLDEALQMAWELVTIGNPGLPMRKVEEGKLEGVPNEVSGLTPGDSVMEAAREAIFKTVRNSCDSTLDKALDIQADHSAAFMAGSLCKKGAIGSDYKKTMTV